MLRCRPCAECRRTPRFKGIGDTGPEITGRRLAAIQGHGIRSGRRRQPRQPARPRRAGAARGL